MWAPSPLVLAQSSALLDAMRRATFTSKIEPMVALDIGCGSGRDAVYLAADGWNVTDCSLRQGARARFWLKN